MSATAKLNYLGLRHSLNIWCFVGAHPRKAPIHRMLGLSPIIVEQAYCLLSVFKGGLDTHPTIKLNYYGTGQKAFSSQWCGASKSKI